MESKEAIWYERLLDMEMAQFTCYFGKMISEERWLFMCGTQRSFTSFATDEFTFPNSTDKCKRTAKTKKKVFFDPTKTTTLQLCCCKSVQSGYQGWSHLKVLLSASSEPAHTTLLFCLAYCLFFCVWIKALHILHPWKKRNNIYPCFALSPQIGKELGCK